MYRSRKTNKKYNPTGSRKKIEAGNKPCPFCKDLGDSVIKSTKYNLIVKNIYGYQYWEFLEVTDHLMIVPRRHIKGLGELTRSERADVMDLICEFEKQGFNVYARQEGSAIKSVPHQHTHLIKTKQKRARLFFYSKKPYIVWKF